MAQFLMAKFLSQALEWKARFPASQFYAGLRYEPFVYEKARLTFPEYNKLYPDNKQFTEKFVKDLRNRNRELLKITDPAVVTAEYEAQDRRFVTEAHLEQQQIAQTNPQEPATQPFSLSTAPLPKIQLAQQKGEAAQTMESEEEEAKQPNMPKVPSAVTSAAENFGSATQRFIGPNLGRIGRGLGEIAGGVGRGIGGPALNGSYNLLGKAVYGGLDAFGRLANISGPKLSGINLSKGFGTGKKVVLAFSLFGLFFGFSLFSAIFLPGQTTPTSEAAPLDTASSALVAPGLDYTLPLRDISIVPLDIKDKVVDDFPNAKIDNWNIIVRRSITEGWNPSFILALWIEESGAQGAASYDDPLGCAPGQPTTDIEISLTCLFSNFDSFKNNQFTDFMVKYAGGTPGQPVVGNDNFPKFPNVIKDWYSRLVPSGPGALTLISTQTTQTAEALGCPTVGTITNPYGYNIPGQPSDIDYYGCSDLLSCHSGIDIAYGRGTTVSTTFDGAVAIVSSDDIKGKYVTISNSQTGYSATFEHLDSQIVSVGESVKRGQVIGTMGSTGATGGVHLHYRLERNSKVINPFRYLGSSGLIATTSLTQSDDIGLNNYQGKVESLNWGQCNQVP